jgi:hypothetical protein
MKRQVALGGEPVNICITGVQFGIGAGGLDKMYYKKARRDIKENQHDGEKHYFLPLRMPD